MGVDLTSLYETQFICFALLILGSNVCSISILTEDLLKNCLVIFELINNNILKARKNITNYRGEHISSFFIDKNKGNVKW